MAEITIDGIKYDTDTFSDNAKAQLTFLQAAEQEIRQLQIKLAIAQTARNAYAGALKTELTTAALEKVVGTL